MAAVVSDESLQLPVSSLTFGRRFRRLLCTAKVRKRPMLSGRRREQPERHGLEVLHDGGEMKLVACAGKAPEPQALEAVMRLQVGKAHLDPLPLIARSQERLCLHFAASDVAGILIDVTHDPARRHVGTAPLFQGAFTAAGHGCEVADCVIAVDPAFGGNLGGASADTSLFIAASILSIALHRDDERSFQGGTAQALVETFTPRA